jgi:2-iminobutanoate/2-iminopropanoate deaminase
LPRRIVSTPKAPKPVGPYSQGVVAGCFLFISGQIPIDPETGRMVDGSFEDRVRRALENLKAIVEASGGTLDSIVKVTVYLTDISLFERFNRVYQEFFPREPPARAVVEVSKLPRGADVEVEAIAYLCES